nr:DUF1566 domain-containing protein [uncultured Campylobacter sp.]
MKKICFALTLLLCCGSAFAFGSVVGNITARFSRDNQLNIVKDDIYKLMWQDDRPIGKMTHSEALRYCDDLKFAGYGDWRLPTINELLSITDDTRFNPAINKAFKSIAYLDLENDKGEKIIYGWYWSSTKSADSSSYAQLVDFLDGSGSWSDVSDHILVRCVRDY